MDILPCRDYTDTPLFSFALLTATPQRSRVKRPSTASKVRTYHGRRSYAGIRPGGLSFHSASRSMNSFVTTWPLFLANLSQFETVPQWITRLAMAGRADAANNIHDSASPSIFSGVSLSRSSWVTLAKAHLQKISHPRIALLDCLTPTIWAILPRDSLAISRKCPISPRPSSRKSPSNPTA